MAFCAYCGADKRTLNVCPSCGVGPDGPPNQPQSASPPPPPAYQQPVYQQPVYQQPIYQSAPRTNGFAIASLVCSLICINVLAIIFGHVALSQIKRTNEGGQGLAIAGLIIGYISLGIVILVVISSGSSRGY